MAKHIDLGIKGEHIARDYLLAKAYTILEENWRFKRAEIDLIAIKNETLVFIEVKTRSYTFYGEPASFVNDKKKSLIMDAASEYMIQINHQWEIRFDIIGIIITPNETQLNHYKDAFFSGI